jgi:hypothetical protein
LIKHHACYWIYFDDEAKKRAPSYVTPWCWLAVKEVEPATTGHYGINI